VEHVQFTTHVTRHPYQNQIVTHNSSGCSGKNAIHRVEVVDVISLHSASMWQYPSWAGAPITQRRNQGGGGSYGITQRIFDPARRVAVHGSASAYLGDRVCRSGSVQRPGDCRRPVPPPTSSLVAFCSWLLGWILTAAPLWGLFFCLRRKESAKDRQETGGGTTSAG
jgi:hypothetical protein